MRGCRQKHSVAVYLAGPAVTSATMHRNHHLYHHHLSHPHPRLCNNHTALRLVLLVPITILLTGTVARLQPGPYLSTVLDLCPKVWFIRRWFLLIYSVVNVNTVKYNKFPLVIPLAAIIIVWFCCSNWHDSVKTICSGCRIIYIDYLLCKW